MIAERHRTVGGLLAVASLLGITASAAAGEPSWPQWGGVNRDFKVGGARLAKKWPKDGPRKLWSVELGDGYSAIVVDGDTLYTMYSEREQIGDQKWKREGQEVVVALDATTGEERWRYAYDAPWAEGQEMQFGPGPHSTPLIVGDRLFTIGCTCLMHCLNKTTGEVLWTVDLTKEYGASFLGHGFGVSPMAYKDNVILVAGPNHQGGGSDNGQRGEEDANGHESAGDKSECVVALKQSDGTLAWRNHRADPAYASPMLIEVDGQKQLIVFTAAEISGLNPDDGELLWTHEHQTQWGANISTPVWCKDNILFISSAYGMGARGLQLTRRDGKTVAKELWSNPQIKIHHGNAVALGKCVYASSGDMGPAFFAAVDIHTGKIAWKKRGFSKATCVYGDRKLILLDEDGMLALARVSPKKMRVLSKHQLCRRVAWTVPTLVGDRLYVRDRTHVFALDVGPDEEKSAAR